MYIEREKAVKAIQGLSYISPSSPDPWGAWVSVPRAVEEINALPAAPVDALVTVARGIVAKAMFTSDEADNLVCEIPPKLHKALKAALTALDGGEPHGD